MVTHNEFPSDLNQIPLLRDAGVVHLYLSAVLSVTQDASLFMSFTKTLCLAREIVIIKLHASVTVGSADWCLFYRVCVGVYMR